MKYFQILLTLVFYSFFAVSCENKNDLPTIPEPEKWVDADFGLKSSWLKIADNGSKMFVMTCLELVTVGENGMAESRYTLPCSNINRMGIGKEVHYWTTYEGKMPFLYVAPNNNPTKIQKISLDIFNSKAVYPFDFSTGDAEQGYFNSQNQLLFLGNLSDSIDTNFQLTIDIRLNADKTDFIDCHILNKQLFHFPSWVRSSLRSSLMIDDVIYLVDNLSTMRIENAIPKIVYPMLNQARGLNIFKWKEKLYIPVQRWDWNSTELGYLSSSDKGISWITEPLKDTIHWPRVTVLNNKVLNSSNLISSFAVSDDLVGFKKMNTEGLPQTDYTYADFYYFGGYYYIFVNKKAYRIKEI